MVQRVNGGIYRDNVLTGSLRFIAIDGIVAAAFEHTINKDTVDVEYEDADGNTFWVGPGQPVAESAAEQVVRLIETRATIGILQMHDTAGDTIDRQIHVSIENAASWGYTNAYGVNASVDDDGAAVGYGLEASIRALGILVVPGPVVGVPGTNALSIDLSLATCDETGFRLYAGTPINEVDPIGGNANNQGNYGNEDIAAPTM